MGKRKGWDVDSPKKERKNLAQKRKGRRDYAEAHGEGKIERFGDAISRKMLAPIWHRIQVLIQLAFE